VSICSNLGDWLLAAASQGQPRFTAQMNGDETEAAGTPLGDDLATLDANLQAYNSLALVPDPSAGTGLDALQADCAQFGIPVTLPGTGG
jgi:hypothetical protein